VIPAGGSKARLLGTVNTWRIIWTIIIFAGIISFLFFMIWWMQMLKKDAVKLKKLEEVEKEKGKK
jgi:magnesium-transporting ATPase (P-type)